MTGKSGYKVTVPVWTPYDLALVGGAAHPGVWGADLVGAQESGGRCSNATWQEAVV